MTRSSHTVTIERDEMHRAVEIKLDGVYVASTNYDETSWGGLELLESTATAFAELLNFKLEVTDREEEDA